MRVVNPRDHASLVDHCAASGNRQRDPIASTALEILVLDAIDHCPAAREIRNVRGNPQSGPPAESIHRVGENHTTPQDPRREPHTGGISWKAVFTFATVPNAQASDATRDSCRRACHIEWRRGENV
jgi:hypothetical protein